MVIESADNYFGEFILACGAHKIDCVLGCAMEMPLEATGRERKRNEKERGRWGSECFFCLRPVEA